jgi:hypothetical protein
MRVERASYEFRFLLVRLVVGVDECGLEVLVAHPFLKRAEGDPDCCHPGAKGMSEVMESDARDAGSSRCSLEPFEQAGTI